MRDGAQMNDDPLDQILAAEEEIVPSSGFAASVMAAVQREATMNAQMSPPPWIPFPWRLAFLGAVACLLLVGGGIASIARMSLWIGLPISPQAHVGVQSQVEVQSQLQAAMPAGQSHLLAWVMNGTTNLANLVVDQATQLPDQMMHAMQQAARMGLGWLLVALLLSYVTVELSMLRAGNRH